jgi:hypothetical protein
LDEATWSQGLCKRTFSEKKNGFLPMILMLELSLKFTKGKKSAIVFFLLTFFSLTAFRVKDCGSMQCDRLLFINLLLAYNIQGERLVLCNAIVFFSLTFFSLTTFRVKDWFYAMRSSFH